MVIHGLAFGLLIGGFHIFPKGGFSNTTLQRAYFDHFRRNSYRKHSLPTTNCFHKQTFAWSLTNAFQQGFVLVWSDQLVTHARFGGTYCTRSSSHKFCKTMNQVKKSANALCNRSKYNGKKERKNPSHAISARSSTLPIHGNCPWISVHMAGLSSNANDNEMGRNKRTMN